jgi:hypothetical protein
MLETAGFSKSNPYYIVEQGKVQTSRSCVAPSFSFSLAGDAGTGGFLSARV